MAEPGTDVAVTRDGAVAIVEMRRPPHNYFDAPLIEALAAAFEALDADAGCRAAVLAAEGRSFCAGASLGGGAVAPAGAPPRAESLDDDGTRRLYTAAVRLFRTRKPIV